MRIAVAATDEFVDGPGEGSTVIIFETEPSPSIVEQYENPALKASAARGIWMIRSTLDRGVKALIVSEAGAPAFTFLKDKADLYLGRGMKVNEAVSEFVNGKLPKMTSPTHEHGNGSHHHGN